MFILLLFVGSVVSTDCSPCFNLLVNCTGNSSCVCLNETLICLKNISCSLQGVQNIFGQLCQTTQSPLDVNVIDHHVNGDFLSTYIETTEVINITINFVNLIFVMYLVYILRVRRRETYF